MAESEKRVLGIVHVVLNDREAEALYESTREARSTIGRMTPETRAKYERTPFFQACEALRKATWSQMR